MSDQTPPQPGETWKRSDGGREVVRIGRVWPICDCPGWTVMHAPDPTHDAPSVDAVRCQPTHGGKWWWTTVPAFVKHFDRCPPRMLSAVPDLQ